MLEFYIKQVTWNVKDNLGTPQRHSDKKISNTKSKISKLYIKIKKEKAEVKEKKEAKTCFNLCNYKINH